MDLLATCCSARIGMQRLLAFSSSIRHGLSMDVIDLEEENQTSLFSSLYVICDDSFTDSLLRLMMASNWLCCFVNLAYMARHKVELPLQLSRNQEINNRII